MPKISIIYNNIDPEFLTCVKNHGSNDQWYPPLVADLYYLNCTNVHRVWYEVFLSHVTEFKAHL